MDRSTYITRLHAQFGAPPSAVIALVERLCHTQVEDSQRLVDGDEYEVHRAVAGDAVVYLRIAKPDAPAVKVYREAWAMEHARRAGVPVPDVLTVEPVETDQGRRHAMLVTAAPGRQLRELLPSMSVQERRRAMQDLGRVLGVLHSVQMSGLGVPDAQGKWPGQAADRHHYLTGVVADCDQLGDTGLTAAEISAARDLLSAELHRPASTATPVLCHGDLSPDHVFVDCDLRVTAIIDWGLWSAGAAADGLADIALRNSAADLTAVLAGHPAADPRDIDMSLLTLGIGLLRWFVTSGQSGQFQSVVVPLRRAIAQLTAGPR